MSIKVKFISEVEVKDGKKTLKAAKNANIKINTSCDGKGKCGKCLVKVLKGKLSEPTKQELKVLGQEKIDKGYRLSCQTTILEDSVIEILNSNEIKVKSDTSVEIKDDTVCNKVEVKKDNRKEIKNDDKVEVKANNKIELKEDTKVATKENSKVLTRNNKKSVK